LLLLRAKERRGKQVAQGALPAVPQS